MALNVAIIGGGVAGLSLGTYLQINGFETEIFEQHDFPGGVCTSWKRKCYLIDGGIRNMVGVKPSNGFFNLWNDVLDMDLMEFHFPEEHFAVEDEEGRRLVFYTDLVKLEQELVTKCPGDARQIADLLQLTKKFSGHLPVTEKPPQLMKIKDQVALFNRMLPNIIPFTNLSGKTNREFSERFTDPLLKKAFIHGFDAEQSVIGSILQLAWGHARESAYPMGGGLYLARQLEKRYLSHGGTVHYNRRVDKVLVENGKATGLSCCDGDAFYADIVVSAADGHRTVYDMLGGKFMDREISERYQGAMEDVSPGIIFISLGINQGIAPMPGRLIFPLANPLQVDRATTVNHLDITHYNYDPVSSPEGKTLITCILHTSDRQWWVDGRKNERTVYNTSKRHLAEEVINRLEERFTRISENIEMVNVATPATYSRYTGNWKGTAMGWRLTPRVMSRKPLYEIKGLKDFYMAGQWTASGGLHNVVMTSNHVAQLICDKWGIEFNAGDY